MSNSPTVLEKTMYTATATAVAGRDGNVKSDDGKLDLSLTPPEGDGRQRRWHEPEQLFAAGYAGCFGSAFAHVARLQKITTGPVHTIAKVSNRPCRKGLRSCRRDHRRRARVPREQAQALLEDGRIRSARIPMRRAATSSSM